MKRKAMAMCLIALLAGCSSEQTMTEKGQYNGQQEIVDQGHYKVDTRLRAQSRPRVKMLVIHYTAGDFNRSLVTLTGPDVSAHYLIPARPPLSDGKPVIRQLVPESELAWHAGVSFWRGATRINDTSIGIELENPGFTGAGVDKQFYPFAPAQIAVLEDLVRRIIARYHIEPQNVVAHGDIAPQRKVDPGPLFPWRELAQQGIGAWPDPARVTFYLNGRNPRAPVDTDRLLGLLSRYGYQVLPGMSEAQCRRVISAFQMHFRPANYSGVADAQSLAIVEALLEKYGQG